MNITINPKPLTGRVAVVSSKSLSHRYLIASGLAEGTSTIKNVLNSDDIDATKDALSALGVKFDGKKIIAGPKILKRNEIDCKESGSTLRFMIPIFLLQNESVTFKGQGRLPYRSLDVYFDIFKKKNIHFDKPEDANLPLTVKGKLEGGLYQMRGDVSSQFLSGLLFSLPLLKEDSVIEITTELESEGYINLTLNVLRLFNIHILKTDQYFYIKGGQKYQSQTATVEGDYSQAAFWMVAGLIGKSIELRHLNPKSYQGDHKIVDIIKEMVGKIEYKDLKRVYKVKPSTTYGLTIDLSQIPDLGPILMILAALSENETTFINASRLRIKESDRLDAMYQTLLKFGVDVEITEDTMKVKGTTTLKGNQSFDTFGDHRIAMAIAIAAIRADGPVTIENAEVVKKSYPKFFEVYQSLGGDIHES